MLIRQFRKMRVTSGILLSKARNRNVTNDSIPTFGVFYSFFRTYDNDNNEPLRSQTCRVNKKNLRSQNKTILFWSALQVQFKNTFRNAIRIIILLIKLYQALTSAPTKNASANKCSPWLEWLEEHFRYATLILGLKFGYALLEFWQTFCFFWLL